MSKALDKFTKQQRLAEQLVKMSAELDQAKHQKKTKNRPVKNQSSSDGDEDCKALRRAGVVFCVAAWQAYAENVIKEVYEAVKSKMLSSNVDEISLLKKFFELNEELLEKRIKYFNTPDSKNLKDLFKDTLKINPNDFWRHAVMISNNGYKSRNTQEIMNFWVNVRHSVAHGSELPMDSRYGEKSVFNLDHKALEDCMKFFNTLAILTDKEINFYLEENFHVTLESTNSVPGATDKSPKKKT